MLRLHLNQLVNLGTEPPKDMLLFAAPNTGKMLRARATANRTGAFFIIVIDSELVQKYAGERAGTVQKWFEFNRRERGRILRFEIDAVGGALLDDEAGSDNKVQRTMLELTNQLHGFDPRGNTKVPMANNRPDTRDPVLVRPVCLG
ncbi:26S protease regulatory subunit 7 [Fasciola hepatica]|uniref:26S protease regulatory subunit 7 n=1 Tax=Fasciola hepatica TaxID=6192 RepID=A0A4E0R3F8_FASHE|nr:26S protease regulatory subunit 7 [Fasciola hepatica]